MTRLLLAAVVAAVAVFAWALLDDWPDGRA